MKPAGRVGDIAFCASDSHGCVSCSHPVQGPATSGSSNSFINELPALREGDPGIHCACCGSNVWTANGGAPFVLINHRRAFRRDDPTGHCGGDGNLIVGSSNVLIGDGGGEGGGGGKQRQMHRIAVRVVFPNGKPARNEPVFVTTSAGQVIETSTDHEGKMNLMFDHPELLEISLLELPHQYHGVE